MNAYETMNISNISVLTCRSLERKKMPLAILSHSFLSSKEFFAESSFMDDLAGAGYFPVSLDSRGHGSRSEFNFKADMSCGKINFKNLLSAINETAADVSLVIDYFYNKNFIEEEKICMIGFSMGGLISFRSMMNDRRIKGVCTIISAFDWNIHPLDPALMKKLSKGESIDDIYEYEKKFNPLHEVEKLSARPVLMHNGKKDKVINYKKVLDSFEKLKEYYRDDPQNLRLEMYNELGHECKAKEWAKIRDNTLVWLKEFF